MTEATTVRAPEHMEGDVWLKITPELLEALVTEAFKEGYRAKMDEAWETSLVKRHLAATIKDAQIKQ